MNRLEFFKKTFAAGGSIWLGESLISQVSFSQKAQSLIEDKAINRKPDQPWEKHGRLRVDKINPHYLSFEDDTPFFWVGDTAWDLFHALTREDAELYLDNRQMKGFNVIQAVAIFGGDRVDKPNAYGKYPLVNDDPTKPAVETNSSDTHYDYWDHVDFIIDVAASKGMFIALLPCWGEYVEPRTNSEKRIFKTRKQAYYYGHFIGKRYRKRKNIIYVLGGDRLPDEHHGATDIWRAMAKGLADGTNDVHSFDGQTDYSNTLMTYHCFQSSSQWFQEDSWLDLNMWGSYHADFYLTRSFQQAKADYDLAITKPTLNAEACYEDHPVNYLPNNGVFTSYDVRQAAYWSVFSGSCGHTYGAQPIWQFWEKGKKPESPTYHTWREALDFEGASQMQHIRHLIESRPMRERRPDNSMLTGNQEHDKNYTPVIRGKGYAFLYLPTGIPVDVELGHLTGEQIKAWWFDPRSGESIAIGSFNNKGHRHFDPPGISEEFTWLQTGRGCDWVLVLDDKNRGFSVPGKSNQW